MFKKKRINHTHGAVNIYERSDGTVVYENIELKSEAISEQEMEKRERILKKLNEVALREKYPLIPEKRCYNGNVIVDKPIEDPDWIRQELMKMNLERNRRILKKKRDEESRN